MGKVSRPNSQVPLTAKHPDSRVITMGKGYLSEKTEMLLLQITLTANPRCLNSSGDENFKGLFKDYFLVFPFGHKI